jgi:hypothetical protein
VQVRACYKVVAENSQDDITAVRAHGTSQECFAMVVCFFALCSQQVLVWHHFRSTSRAVLQARLQSWQISIS